VDINRLRRDARKQHSLFTHAQAIDAGVPERMIERLVERGEWEEIEQHVYLSGPSAAPSWQQRLHALVLSVEGVAFGRSAVALYGLLPPPSQPEVLVIRASRNRLRDGIHSTRLLPASDLTRVGNVPATMPARSVIDACSALTFEACCQLVDAAVVRRLVRPHGLARRAAELGNSKRPGCARVLRALSVQHPQLDRARNEWEALTLRLAKRAGLPDPVPNHPIIVGGQRRLLDLAWPDAKVVLEFDGFRPHTVRAVFDDDRVRQNALVSDGWLVFRATSRMLERDPASMFAAIGAALRGRGHDIRHIRRVS